MTEETSIYLIKYKPCDTDEYLNRWVGIDWSNANKVWEKIAEEIKQGRTDSAFYEVWEDGIPISEVFMDIEELLKE